MMKKLLFTAALGLAALQSSFAQVSAYAFSQGISQYSAALTGTFVGHSYQDDTVNVVNLPFSFLFNGNNYTSVNVSSNGFVSFGTIPAAVYNPISNSSTQEVISIFGQDLQTGMRVAGNLSAGSNTITGVSLLTGISVGDSIVNSPANFSAAYPKIVSINGTNIVLNANANVTASGYNFFVLNGAIRTQQYGTAPYRMFEIEFRNFSRKSSSNEVFNFKMRFWETIERITMVYGQAAAGTSTSTCEIGLKGASTADFKSRKVGTSNSYISSQPATVITDNCIVSPTQYPFGGVTYTWRPVCDVPNFSLTSSSTNSFYCAGRSVTLTASTSTLSSHLWFGPGVTTQSANPQIVVSPTSAVASYTLITDEGPCTSTAAISLSLTSAPVVSVTQNPSSICVGGSATLTASGTNSYTWVNFGNTNSIVVTPTAVTVYTVIGSNGACETEVQVTETVMNYPVLTIASSHSLPCNGTNITLTGGGAATYSWSNGKTTATISVNPQSTTTYTLTGFNGSCASTMAVTQNVKNCNSISESALLESVSLYPNPFTTDFTIRYLDGNQNSEVTVADISGRIIENRSVPNSAEVHLETGKWTAGVYFVTIRKNEGAITLRMIKE